MTRARTGAAVLAAVAVALAACGDGGDPVDDLDTGGGDQEVTTTSAPDEADEIVAAYEASWNDVLAVGDPPQPESPVLAEHNTGDALLELRSMLRGYLAEGISLRGTYEFDAEVVETGPTTAVVHDCGLNKLEGVVTATGESVERSDDQRDGLVADMVVESGVWKVTKITKDAEVCASA